MKIFISWSGTHSRNVAIVLRDWLPYIFNGIEIFVSSEDIRKGKRWPLEVSKELETSNFGIACLTPDNLEAPWLLFESGALSKSVKEAALYTLLFGGLKVGDIEGPLSHFQHTVFEKNDFYKLLKSINELQGQTKYEPQRLRTVFEKWWEDLEIAVGKALKDTTGPEKKRSVEDMVREVLEIVSQIAKKTPEIRVEPLIRPKPVVENKHTDEWSKFLDAVGARSPFTRTYLLESRGSFSNGTLTIVFDPEFEDHIGLVDNARNRLLLQNVSATLGYGDNCKIVIKKSNESSDAPQK